MILCMVRQDEVCKFFGFMEGKECTPEDVESTPDLSQMVGKSAEDAKVLIMKMCDDEEKLDAIIAVSSTSRARCSVP